MALDLSVLLGTAIAGLVGWFVRKARRGKREAKKNAASSKRTSSRRSSPFHPEGGPPSPSSSSSSSSARFMPPPLPSSARRSTVEQLAELGKPIAPPPPLASRVVCECGHGLALHLWPDQTGAQLLRPMKQGQCAGRGCSCRRFRDATP